MNAEKIVPVVEIRKSTSLNQAAFWSNIGLTQSAGSRYENGRNISKPIQFLLEIAYGKSPDALIQQLRSVAKPIVVKVDEGAKQAPKAAPKKAVKPKAVAKPKKPVKKGAVK